MGSRVASGAVVAVVAALVMVGCGSAKPKTSGSSTTSESTTSTSSATTSTSAACQFSGTTGTSENSPAVATPFLLTDVGVVTSGCTDTITFTFRSTPGGDVPHYVVEPATPPFAQAGSGAPIAVPGSKFLKVRFQPAWIVDVDAPSAPLTYTGPRVITPAGTTVTRGVVMFDASEAVVGWIVGLDGSGEYTVTAGSSPPSVTITVGR